MKMIENEMNVNVSLEIVKASEIEPKEVKWLWYPYIPFGKVTLLQGDPGDGKSKLMLSVAALLSKGEPLPFTETEENEPVTIIYQTTEDDADDTVVPRFNSAGGNGENLIFIREDEKSLSFGDNRIREAIEMYHAKLFRSVHRWYTAELLTRPRITCSRLPRMAVSWGLTRGSSTRCCRTNLAQRSISVWTTSCRSGGTAKLTS